MHDQPKWWPKAEKEINAALVEFTKDLRSKMDELSDRPQKVLATKNPFLFRIRGCTTSTALADAIILAFLSSSEETRFGQIFEDCALAVAHHGRSARKSSSEGIDIEWDCANGTRVLVQVKSSANWGNSSQKKQMKANFNKARRILSQGSHKPIRCIEGISYGKASHKAYGTHERIVGPFFWREISQWSGAYCALMKIVSRYADNGLEEHRAKVRHAITDFMEAKSISYNGIVVWDKFLETLHAP